MILPRKKGFILPLALMVLSAVAFTFLVWLSLDKKQEGDKADIGAVSSDCVKSGCSGQVCADEGSDIITTCEIQAWYSCLSLTRCEKQKTGKCGWTENSAFVNCMTEKNLHYNQN
jgi:eight-cysteine-cluster-containing protein